jgi:CheY-like chemotaxis protein
MPMTRVAYVEDEADIRELAEIALDAIGGLEVRTFPSGAEALRGLPGFAPDLILLDVMMPEMNGRELFAELNRMEGMKDIPKVFMTAKSMASEIQQLRAMGAVGVIPKPFDPMSLSEELQRLYSTATGSRSAVA